MPYSSKKERVQNKASMLLPISTPYIYSEVPLHQAASSTVLPQRYNRWVLLVLCALATTWSGKLAAQDMHFSQFYTSPQTLNPAMVGLFAGKYRVSANYRNQWGAAVRSKAFKTIAAGLEIKFPVPNNDKDGLGAGLLVYNDKAGSGSMSTTYVGLSGAYHKSLGYSGRSMLSAGFQGSIGIRNVTYDQFTFSDQFNGSDGYTLATGEYLPRNSIAYGDLSTGVFYSFRPERKSGSFYVGLSAYHLNVPNISFYKGVDGAPKVALPIKLGLQVGGDVPFGEHKQNSLLPRIVTSWQGTHWESNIGTNVRLLLDPYGDAALQLGAWARPVKDVQSSISLDAVVLMGAIEYKGLLIGMSFDSHISDLTDPGPKRAAFEVSITYIGEYEDEDPVSCPTF